MLCNVTGFSIGVGMSSALNTLCSQAFTASMDMHALGKHLQRGIVVNFMLAIPISFLWFYTENVLLFLGQDEEVSQISGVICRWMVPGLFASFLNSCLQRYLQAQGTHSRLIPRDYETDFMDCYDRVSHQCWPTILPRHILACNRYHRCTHCHFNHEWARFHFDHLVYRFRRRFRAMGRLGQKGSF